MRESGQRFGGWLLIDADWFGRKRCLIIYRDYPTGKTLLWRHEDREYKTSIYQDIHFLVNNGYPLKGVTSDWKGSIVAAVRDVSLCLNRDIPHQRCLVHTQLSSQRLLTQNPKTQPGRELLEIVYQLNSIRIPYEANIWIRWLRRWGERYRDFVNERTYSEDGKHWWYTHKYVRRVWKTLSRDVEPFFVYLKNPLPKDTNGIEGTFSQLDTKLARHRGMARERIEKLISWYFYLREFPKTSFGSVRKTHT